MEKDQITKIKLFCLTMVVEILTFIRIFTFVDSLFRFIWLTVTEKQFLTASNRVFKYGKIQRKMNRLEISNAK